MSWTLPNATVNSKIQTIDRAMACNNRMVTTSIDAVDFSLGINWFN